MSYPYSLLAYTGLAGALLLLVLEGVPRLHSWRKPTTACWLTLMTLFWLALPSEGRLLFSRWSPSTVLGGQLLLDITPAIWCMGLAVGLAFSGVAWVELGDSRPPAPLAGVLALLVLLVVWVALASGSILTMLVAWAIFDLLWAAAGLLAGGDGERITFGLALHGLASLTLWVVALLLGRWGDSVLWWLMRPPTSILVLLLAAALLRVGIYPAHIVFPRRTGNLSPLLLISLLGSVLGMGLLARLSALPGIESLQPWVLALGAISLLWGGARAWSERGAGALSWSAYALLGGIVAGSGGGGTGEAVLAALAVWFAGWTLLQLSRGREARRIFWSWAGWLALLFLLGAPPSPVGALFRAGLARAPWGWRLVLILGGALTSATLIREGARPAVGVTSPPWPWQRASLFVGLALPVGGLVGGALLAPAFPFSWPGLGLWGVTLAFAGGLVWLGRPDWQPLKPVLELLDLQWLYHSLWRGAEHLLGMVRVVAEVVEGSGALLWSLLVILLGLLVALNR